MPKKGVLLLSLLILCAVSFAAGEFYRYRNDEGVLVLDYQIPPHLVENGYEVVSASGQVIEVVPPHKALTEAERLAAKQAERQELEDQILLKSYSSLEDLNNARDRKLEGIQREINIITSNVEEGNSLLASVRSKAANLQRAGKPVSQKIVEQIDTLIQEIKDSKTMLSVRRQEYEEMEARYDRYAERLKLLFGGSTERTGSPSSSATAPSTSPSGGG